MGREKACGEHLSLYMHQLSHLFVMHVGSEPLAKHAAVDATSLAAVGKPDRWDAVYRHAVLP